MSWRARSAPSTGVAANGNGQRHTESDARRFARLHRVDVALVGAALLLGGALLAGAVFVLPSLFAAA